MGGDAAADQRQLLTDLDQATAAFAQVVDALAYPGIRSLIFCSSASSEMP